MTFEPNAWVVGVRMFEEVGRGGLHHILTAVDTQRLVPILPQSGWVFAEEASVCPAADAVRGRRIEVVSGSARAIIMTNVVSMRIRFGMFKPPFQKEKLLRSSKPPRDVVQRTDKRVVPNKK